MSAPLIGPRGRARPHVDLDLYAGHAGFVRDGRRQEIESDLWEQQRDLAGESDARVAAHLALAAARRASPTICSGVSSIAAR